LCVVYFNNCDWDKTGIEHWYGDNYVWLVYMSSHR